MTTFSETYIRAFHNKVIEPEPFSDLLIGSIREHIFKRGIPVGNYEGKHTLFFHNSFYETYVNVCDHVKTDEASFHPEYIRLEGLSFAVIPRLDDHLLYDILVRSVYS